MILKAEKNCFKLQHVPNLAVMIVDSHSDSPIDRGFSWIIAIIPHARIARDRGVGAHDTCMPSI
eukprot:COSAG02_NODE_39596_length_415_cov_0.829114_1_plen_63_part_10